MLIGLFLVLFGGSSLSVWVLPENFGEQAEEIIVDENRREKAVGIYEEMDKIIDEHNKSLEGLADSFAKALDNSAAEDSEFKSWINKLVKERREYEREILSARKSLVENITKEEWEKILAPAEE